MRSSEKITFEARHGHSLSVHENIIIIRIERPEVANSLDVQTCRAMSATIDAFSADDSLSAAIICAKGRHYCAGMDLGMVAPGKRVELPPTGFGGLTARWIDKPLIAAVNGAAFGGGFELALACDLIVADKTARFCLPEPRVGQAALAGGLTRLPQRVGQARALDLVLTGRELNLAQAVDWGLVARSAEEGAVLETAIKLAKEVVRGAPLSLRVSKSIVRSTEHKDSEKTNAKLTENMLDSQDALEGSRAFKEKRQPHWSGR